MKPLPSLIPTFLICLGAGVIYIVLETMFNLQETNLITKGLAYGLGIFLVLVSFMLSTDAYKMVKKGVRK